MPPKPRQTIRAPPSSSSSSSSSPSNTTTTSHATPHRNIRRRRWIYAKPTLSLLLLLHACCHIFGFILLTEPCLNPNYVNSLWSKRNYFSLLTTEGLIPQEEWKERFLKAAVRGLFGVGVIQAWFVARLNSYIQKGERVHNRLVSALRSQREGGGNVGIPLHLNNNQEQEQGKEQEVQIPLPAATLSTEVAIKNKDKSKKEIELEVGSFIRQLESVGMTFLGLPFIWIVICFLLVLFGAPILGKFNFSATAILAAYLTLLLALPLIHILGLPDDSSPSSSSSSSSSSPLSSTTTNITNTNNHYRTLIQLKPNPSFLYPLFYPLIFSSFATLLSTAALVLDWNVAWQSYPYPLLVGSLAGMVLGDFYTLFIIIFD